MDGRSLRANVPGRLLVSQGPGSFSVHLNRLTDQFEVQGDPVNSKACHCKVRQAALQAADFRQTCQHLHGAPFQHAVLFHKNAFRLVQNEDDSLTFFSCVAGRIQS